jgi:hypothetical protein
MFYSLNENDVFIVHLNISPESNNINLRQENEEVYSDIGSIKCSIKKMYRDLICQKCGNIDDNDIFESGYFPPFIMPKEIIKHAVDFCFTRSGQLIVSDKFIECLKENSVSGYEEKPIGSTGWHALKIIKFCEDYIYRQEPECDSCQKSKWLGRKLDANISIDSSNSLFTSRDPIIYDRYYNLSREIFMTEDVAKSLKKFGIKGGYCKSMPINPKTETDFYKTPAILLKGQECTSNPSKKIKRNPKVLIEAISKSIQAKKPDLIGVEKHINNSLSSDYKKFILKYNGGVPAPNRYGDDEYEIDHFYSLQELPQAWEEFQLELKEAMGGTLPEDTLLPIAPDTSGNTFCLAIAGPNTGRIALFDHEENDYNFVEDSFTAFFNSLKKASVEEE